MTSPTAAAVITCSDSAALGVAADQSGPAAQAILRSAGFDRIGASVVADDVPAIVGAVMAAVSSGAQVVILTGGTGIGPRDLTPEALGSLGMVPLPGIGERIRAASRDSVPTADLSRATAGVVSDQDGRRALVVALPGSPGGVRDGLAAVLPLVGHALEAMRGAGHGPRGPGGADPTSPAGPAQSHRPPGGRGSDRAAVTRASVDAEPIEPAELERAVAVPAAGAVVCFVGRVRDRDHGRTVNALVYEAHPDAAAEMAAVAADAAEWPEVLAVAAAHRVGALAIGEVAFVVAVSAAHRAPAFAACARLVDEAKSRLPIWKYQRFADGSSEWVNLP